MYIKQQSKRGCDVSSLSKKSQFKSENQWNNKNKAPAHKHQDRGSTIESKSAKSRARWMKLFVSGLRWRKGDKLLRSGRWNVAQSVDTHPPSWSWRRRSLRCPRSPAVTPTAIRVTPTPTSCIKTILLTSNIHIYYNTTPRGPNPRSMAFDIYTRKM
jgi:hypothetical protein